MVGLLIITFVHCDIAKQVTGQLHRAHDLFNELDFTRRDAVFGVQILVRPFFVPLLSWDEGVDLACGVLRRLVQKNQQAGQTACEVRQGAFGLALAVERADAEIGFGTDAAWLTNKRRAEDAVRVGVAIAGARRSTADINLPFVDEFGTCRYRISGDICRTAVLIDRYVTVTLLGIASKKGTKSEGS